MGSLLDLYIKKETLETLAKTVAAKGEKGISITVSVNDDTNDYGNNTSAYVSQSKEEREAKKDRFWVGNGKVFWTDGTIKRADKKEEAKADISEDLNDDLGLPF